MAENEQPESGEGAKPGGKKGKPEAAAAPQASPLQPNRWSLKEYRNPGHWVCVPYGTTIDDLLRPEFWANVAGNLKRSATIEVHWDDASQYAELYVLDAGRNWAALDVLFHKKEIRRAPLHEEAQFDVSFNGPVDRFRIIRRKDGAVIQAGFASEADALRALADYKKKIAT